MSRDPEEKKVEWSPEEIAAIDQDVTGDDIVNEGESTKEDD